MMQFLRINTATLFLLWGLSAGGQTVPIDDLVWQWVHPRPQGNVLNAAAVNGTRYVAVGDGGVAMFSEGLANFQLADTGSTESLQGVVRDGAQFVAFGGSRGGPGNSAIVLTSVDGEEWQRADLPVSLPTLGPLAYSGALFVTSTSTRLIFGDAPGTMEFGALLSFFINDVAWMGSEFLVVGNDGSAATTTDGETATPLTTGVSFEFLSATGNGDTWVIGGRDGVVTSTDAGATWDQTLSVIGINAVEWDGQQFLAFRTSGIFYTSPDGENWTEQPTIEGATAARRVEDMVVGPAGRMAVGGAGAIYTSPNGLTWTQRLEEQFTLTLLGAANNGSQFVISSGEGTILTSDNGIQFDLSSPGVPGGLDAIWDGARFIVVGGDGLGASSPDGLDWTDFDTGVDDDLRAIARGATRYVAVGGDGTIVSSADLMDWRVETSGSAARLESVIWTGERFVVGGQDVLLSSEDGVTWTPRMSPIGGDHQTLVTNGSVHLIGPDGDGEAGYSTDGITWQSVSTGDSGGAFDGLWNGSEFVLFMGTSVRVSPDGLDWREIFGVRSTQGRAATGFGDTYLVVGAGSSILRSAPAVIFADGFEL